MSGEVTSQERTAAARSNDDKPRWRELAPEFVFNMIGFGLITELVESWSDSDHDFTLWAVPIRGFVFAVLMLAFSLWVDRRKKRQASATDVND